MKKRHIKYSEIADFLLNKNNGWGSAIQYETPMQCMTVSAESLPTAGNYRQGFALLLDIASSLRSIDRTLKQAKRRPKKQSPAKHKQVAKESR